MSLWSPRAWALRRAAQMLAARPVTAIFAVVLCAAALALPLLAATAAYGVRPLAARAPIAPELTVFIADASRKDLESLQARIESIPGVAHVRHVTREAALAELQQRSGLATLGQMQPNPLPDTLIVVMAFGAPPAAIEAAASAIGKLPQVDSVRFDLAWYRKLAQIARLGSVVGATAGAVLIALVALAIFGAIRLLVPTSAQEASVLRLVGADERFVARPSVYMAGGALAVSALLAVGAVAALLRLVNFELAKLGYVYGAEWTIPMLPVPVLGLIVFAALLLGALLGRLVGSRQPRPKA